MFIQSVRKGILNGLRTTWMLAKVMVPVYIGVTILQATPALDYAADFFRPLMALFALPGEAALILVLGNALNLYAAIGAMSAVALETREVTVIALMLSFSHSLFVETAVTKKLGVGIVKVVVIRLGLAAAVGLLAGGVGGVLW